MTVRVATPPGFEPIPQVVQRATEIAVETGGSVELLHDPSRLPRARTCSGWAAIVEHADGTLTTRPME